MRKLPPAEADLLKAASVFIDHLYAKAGVNTAWKGIKDYILEVPDEKMKRLKYIVIALLLIPDEESKKVQYILKKIAPGFKVEIAIILSFLFYTPEPEEDIIIRRINKFSQSVVLCYTQKIIEVPSFARWVDSILKDCRVPGSKEYYKKKLYNMLNEYMETGKLTEIKLLKEIKIPEKKPDNTKGENKKR